MSRKADQTRRWNGVPSGSTWTPSSARKSLAKYARTRSLTAVRSGVPSNGSPKRKARRASPSSARWTGPMGVSTVSMRSMRAPSRKPDCGGGIPPPGSPALGPFAQRSRRQPERLAETEIGGGKRVGLAQAAKRDELRGPIADSRQLAERFDRPFQILRSVQAQLAAADGAGQAGDGIGARRGHPAQAAVGQLLWSGKDSEPANQIHGHRPRMPDRDLLAEDRSHGHLEGVPGAGHAQTRPEERFERRIGREVLDDG